MASRFASEFGVVKISAGDAIRNVIQIQAKTHLAQEIEKNLRQGKTVPDELTVKAIEICLLDMKCQTRGYVLDGYPLTRSQIELMTERSLIPLRVIELNCSNTEIVDRATKDRFASDRPYVMHDSTRIFAVKCAAYKKEIAAVKDWYRGKHDNLVSIDGDRSKWWVWNSAAETARKSVRRVQDYLSRIIDGKAACVADLCITPTEFSERIGSFGQYCCVSLGDRGELVDCAGHPNFEFTAEFRSYYYRLGGKEELDLFLENPEKYVPPLAPHKLPPPELLPIRRTAAEAKALFPMTVDLNGYCPVTFLDGRKRYESIVPGDSNLVVEYRNKLHYFDDEEKLYKFMRLPEKYFNLTLPHKLPPKKEPIQVTSLPMLGYMEQSAADGIIKALTAVGNVKPKYPFLTVTQSSLIYMAYHLKG